MVKEKEIKKTYYTLDIKNPYCSKGEFAWKHNDDSTLGKKIPSQIVEEERKRIKNDLGLSEKESREAHKHVMEHWND